MDCERVGGLILRLRKEKGLTQRQLAEALHVSDKAVSKWERGLGCPDVSLLSSLCGIFGVNIEKMLIGDLEPNSADGGNMKKLKFYVCSSCANVMTATGAAEISCCGRKLAPLEPKQADDEHKLDIATAEDDFYITFSHEMEKHHYISFIAYVTYNKMMLVKLYPEQGGEARFARMNGGKLYYYCSNHGLLYA